MTPYEQKKRAFRDGMVFQPFAAAHLFEPSSALHALSGSGDRTRFARLEKMMTEINLRGRRMLSTKTGSDREARKT